MTCRHKNAFDVNTPAVWTQNVLWCPDCGALGKRWKEDQTDPSTLRNVKTKWKRPVGGEK